MNEYNIYTTFEILGKDNVTMGCFESLIRFNHINHCQYKLKNQLENHCTDDEIKSIDCFTVEACFKCTSIEAKSAVLYRQRWITSFCHRSSVHALDQCEPLQAELKHRFSFIFVTTPKDNNQAGRSKLRSLIIWVTIVIVSVVIFVVVSIGIQINLNNDSNEQIDYSHAELQVSLKPFQMEKMDPKLAEKRRMKHCGEHYKSSSIRYPFKSKMKNKKSNINPKHITKNIKN